MGRTQVVYDSKIAQDINAKLIKLAANPKRFSVKQIVEQVQDGIVAALDAGHDWDDILSVFSEYNIELKKTTVQRYLRQFRSNLDDPPPLRLSPSDTSEAESNAAPVTVQTKQVDEDSCSRSQKAISLPPGSDKHQPKPSKPLTDTKFVEIDEEDL